MKARVHGGYQSPGVIDFSAPMNPLGTPNPLAEAVSTCVKREVYKHYPDSSYKGLRKAIALFHPVDEDEIIVLNGAAEALNLIPLAVKAKSLIVIEPSFGDHELLAKAAEISLCRLTVKPTEGVTGDTVEKIIEFSMRCRQPTVIYLSRPNNPIGYIVSEKVVEEIASRIPANAVLVVDEAFIDISLGKPLHPSESWILVRSFTKTFAAPGLRLGYVATKHHRIYGVLDSVRQAWPVDSMTACSYEMALSQYASELKRFVEEARRVVEEGLRQLSTGLKASGLEAYPSKAPFLLVRHSGVKHPELNRRLLDYGVYVRDASSFYGLGPEYSRISVRRSEENTILLQALKEVLGWAS